MRITIEDKDFIIKNVNKLNLTELAIALSGRYTEKQIKNFCNNNRIEYRKKEKTERKERVCSKQRQQTPINHDYFKTWSRNMAYIFGLWCADGYVSYQNNTYQFSIKLHKRDKRLLKDILSELQSQHIIYENSDNSCLFSIGSKTIVQDIIGLGGKENKSLNLNFPYIPDEYLSCFIRGYFDGDGCISFNKSKRGYFSSISSGDVSFLMELLSRIQKINPTIRGSICKNTRDTNSSTYKICWGKEDTFKLGNLMYGDCDNEDLKMLRKYNLFKKDMETE